MKKRKKKKMETMKKRKNRKMKNKNEKKEQKMANGKCKYIIPNTKCKLK